MSDEQFFVVSDDWSSSEATEALRFVRRGGEKILQQGFRVTTFKNHMPTGCSQEWHDVPLEEET